METIEEMAYCYAKNRLVPIIRDLQMGREQKEKRRGGARDDSEIYISYTRDLSA